MFHLKGKLKSNNAIMRNNEQNKKKYKKKLLDNYSIKQNKSAL